MSRNGTPRPMQYATRSKVPWATVPLVAAIVRIPPRMIPMQGVQPIAKIAPRPSEASRPPFDPTSAPPSRSPKPGVPPAPVDNAIEPVVVARLPAAPASSGRHVRSSAGMCRIPARLRPMTMRINPPTTRRSGRMSTRPDARYVAVTPSNANTAVNPNTNAKAWRTASQRPGRTIPAPATAIALSWPRYAGTSGSTHGERKLIRPAASATRMVRSVPEVIPGSSQRSRQDVAEESAELGRARGELEASVGELDDRNPVEVLPLEVGVGLDIDLGQSRCQK